MPGTTMASNTRASRSRFSSPQINNQSPNGSGEQASAKAPASGLDSQKAFMARWLEPPVQVKPSYQDAGLMRHGVVEGMAPLGTLPKAGIFKKTAAPAAPESTPPQNPPAPTRKIILKRPVLTATPKPVPAPPAPVAPTEDDTEEVDDSEEEADDDSEEALAPPPPASRRRSLRNEDDDDWAPGPSKAASLGTKSINTRRSFSRASAGRPSIALSSPSMHQTSASSVSRAMESMKDVADKVVEAAVDEALKHFRYPTAWALRRLYDENSDNNEFLSMIQEVFTQTADSETVEEFARLLNQKKKAGKKGNTGFLYFIPPTTSNAITPNKPKRAPYASLVRLDIPKIGFNREHDSSERDNEQELEQALEQDRDQDHDKDPHPDQDQGSQKKKRKKLPEEAQSHTDETPSKRQRRKSASKASESATPSSKVMASAGKKRNCCSTSNGNGKAKLTESPSMRRKARADSSSSSSTLSSARSLTPPDGLEEESVEDGDGVVLDVPPSRTSPAAGKSNNANAPTAPQPIARPRRNNAPKKNRDVSPSTPAPSSPGIIPGATTNNTTTANTRHQKQQSSAAADAASSMPALIEPPIFPNLPPPKKSAYKAAGAHLDKDHPVFASRVGRLNDDDKKTLLRQKAKKVTNDVALEESFARHLDDAQEKQASTLRSRLREAAIAGGDGRAQAKFARAWAAETASGQAGNCSTTGSSLSAAAKATRSSRKRSHDELDDEVSPTTVHFPPGALDVASSTAANSRAGTPVLRPAKKARTGLRVKNSPMKKKNGTSAGIPRASGERNSPAPNGFSLPKEDDNDDYCSSCGGNGELLCCDGCTRAFHLNCVDPPLFEDRMPADWFCNACRSVRSSFAVHSGAFGSLLERLDSKNSSAFRLPAAIRDYFEGVRTGVDGEYEEIVAVQKHSRKKKTEEEVPDFFRLRDNEGNPIFCHMCSKPTADNRAIVPCSVCGLWWHLDCLDPPLAHPPVLRTWKCPAHVDDLLAKIPGARGPAHKFRKIKGAPDITPAFSRGNINNGYIDIIDESEDESGWKDVTTFGRYKRLPAKGILRDFSSQVRLNRKGKPIAPVSEAVPRPEAPQPVAVDVLEHQQAALNLVQLSGKDGAGITTLVDTLLANADPSVIALMARANAQHVSEVSKLDQFDEQGLRAMLAQMDQMKARIRDLLVDRSDITSPATPISAEKLPDNYRRHSTPGRPFDALIANLPGDPTVPVVSEGEESKELPSPPATDQPDERPKSDVEQEVIVAAMPADEIKSEDQEDCMDLD